MEDMIPCAVKDQEVFRRVWQRVMEGRDQADSPIQPGIPGGWEGDVSCECLEALMRQGGTGLPPECEHQKQPSQPAPPRPSESQECPSGEPETPPVVTEVSPEGVDVPPMEAEPSIQNPQSGWQSAEETPAPEPPCGECGEGSGLPPEDGPDRGNDLPRLWEEPQPADDRTARLRRHVMDALEGWQFYRHLSKRTRGTDARMLNSMAAEQHKEARKLSAAYFLLTGLRYWPSEMLGMPAIPSYWGRCAPAIRRSSGRRTPTAWRRTTGRTPICWRCTTSSLRAVSAGPISCGACWNRALLKTRYASVGAPGPVPRRFATLGCGNSNGERCTFRAGSVIMCPLEEKDGYIC